MLRTIKSLSGIVLPLFCTVILYSALVSFISINLSCNSSSQKIVTTDSIIYIQLPEPSPVSASESARIYQPAKAWFDLVLKASGFNGGMLIAKNGNVIFEGYNGTAHIPGKDSITANTPMHIASTSKTFTAMAILKLWQEGKLDLEDDLTKYFPQFNYPGVTIKTLLNHRSGLPNYTHYMEEKIEWDKTKIATNEDILNTLILNKAILPAAPKADTKFAYCNTNFALLALVIEKVTGKKYSEYLQQTFFKPLQMKNTFVFDIADTAKVQPSYDWRNTLQPFNFLDAVYGDKNIYTTPRDLMIWDRALKSGTLFTEKTMAAAYTPYSNERPGVKNYGLGWRMNIYPNGKKIVFHNGWWHGSNSVFTRMLEDSVTIIVIGNKFNRNIYHTAKLANLFGEYYSGEEEDNETSKNKDSLTIFKNPELITTSEPLDTIQQKQPATRQVMKPKKAKN
ncbi:MAG: serine hydrolase domain-containing protein [Bacteroidota bacterium]